MHEQYIEIIRKARLPFVAKNFEPLTTGANSVAILVNNEYVCRFLLNREKFYHYRREEKFLNCIGQYIKLTKIPQVDICEESEMPFSYHKIIEGKEYCQMQSPTNSFKQKVAREIALFCKELHSINVDLVDGIAVEEFNPSSNEIAKNILILKEILGSDCSGDINKNLDVLNNYKSLNEGDYVVSHGDLHERNIIVNGDGLSGIIDFEYVKIRRFEDEFTHLFGYDAELNLMIVNEYQLLTGRKIDIEYIFARNKLRIYWNLARFFEKGNQRLVEMFVGHLANIEGWKLKINM